MARKEFYTARTASRDFKILSIRQGRNSQIIGLAYI